MFAKKDKAIKRLKKTIIIILTITLTLMVGSVALLNIPYVQQRTSVIVAQELSALFDTEVSIKKINAGLINRIIIDDLLLHDRQGREMLKVARLSARFDLFALLRGRISIGSVQLFGFNISLNQKTPDDDPNFKFIIDALSPRDSVQNASNIDLRINSVLIRRGTLSYDVLSADETPGKFNPKHIKLYNIIGNISLKALQNDSINAQIKRFSVDEQSGLELRKLTLKVLANNTDMTIENFEVDLPGTSLKMDTVRMQYDSLGAFNNFVSDVRFSLGMLPSHITPEDISPFVPALAHFKEKINLEVNASGTIDQLNCSRLQINSANNHLRMRGDVQFQGLSNPAEAFIYGNLSQFSMNREGVNFLVRNFSRNYTETPPLLQRLGNVSFTGEITGFFTELVTYGSLQTDLGIVKGDVKLSSDREKDYFAYSGGVETTNFMLGKWLNNDNWGTVSYEMNVESKFYADNRYPVVVMKGMVKDVEYSDYKYENITLDGVYKNGGFDGTVKLDDTNGMVLLNGKINLSERIPTFNFHAEVQDVRPHNLKLTPKYEDATFSLKLNADFTGGNIDEMAGAINIDSISFSAPQKELFIENINMTATHYEAKSTLKLESEFLCAKVEGKYSYRTLMKSLSDVICQYLPSVFPRARGGAISGHNNFTFEADVYDAKILPIIFDVPFNLYGKARVCGYFNDYNHRLKLEGYFPRFSYGNFFAESGMILCDNSSDDLHSRIRMANIRKNSVVNLSMDVHASNDQISTRINWGNNAEVTYSGHFEALTSFFRDLEAKGKAPLNTVIDIAPTQVILNDTTWNVHASRIDINPEMIHIDKFLFSSEDQYIQINGYASDELSSSIKLDLKDINIDYVFELLNFRSVDFKGSATGSASINRALKNPVMNTSLFVKRFRFNNALMGDMHIYGEWDNEKKGIYLSADINEADVSANHVSGYIYPVKPNSGLDLHIDANHLNVGFMQEYLDGIIDNLQGRVSGVVDLFGGFKTLNVAGKAKADAIFRVKTLETFFALNDSVKLTNEKVEFDNVNITDLEGHAGTATGSVEHQHFKNMKYNFKINANNLLVMDLKENPDLPFYGTVYATGNASLYGNSDALNVEAALTTNRNTTFVYTLAESASAGSNQFIRFVDKTPVRTFQDSIPSTSEFELAQRRQLNEEDESEIDLHINLQIDATPDATVRIIMDPASGDYITGSGSGNIRAQYFNKGDVRMFGNYIIDQGVYKFSFLEVIRKDFMLNQGSSVVFNGEPLDATLDIQAIYTVNSASLTDLIPDNPELIKRKNVKVNCLMNLTGPLYNPNIRLGFDLPNEREEIQELVSNYVSTEEEINMQILYLLGIGKFYTPDHLSTTQNSNMMTSVISSTLSGQLNNIFSQFMDNKNWNFGTNVSTGEQGWTDVEVEGILSAQLLNNRLIINGNFGYRENPLSDTNFIGDFDAQWLLIPSGDLRLKAYNQTNDRFITRTNLTTQGVGILYKKEFERWRDLFFWLNLRKKKNNEELPKTNESEVAKTEQTPK